MCDSLSQWPSREFLGLPVSLSVMETAILFISSDDLAKVSEGGRRETLEERGLRRGTSQDRAMPPTQLRAGLPEMHRDSWFGVGGCVGFTKEGKSCQKVDAFA